MKGKKEAWGGDSLTQRCPCPNVTGLAGTGTSLAGWHLLGDHSSIPGLLRALGQSLPLGAQVPRLQAGTPHLSPKGTRLFLSRKPVHLQVLAPSCTSSNTGLRPLGQREQSQRRGRGFQTGLFESALQGFGRKGSPAPQDPPAWSFLPVCCSVNKAFVNPGGQRLLFSKQTRERVARQRWGGEIGDCHRRQGCTESMKMPVGSLGEKSAVCCLQADPGGWGVQGWRSRDKRALPCLCPPPPLSLPPPLPSPLSFLQRTNLWVPSPHPPHSFAWQVVCLVSGTNPAHCGAGMEHQAWASVGLLPSSKPS